MKQSYTLTVNKSVDIASSELNELKNGIWQIDCPHMTIRGHSDDNPVTFSGPGFLFQSAGGHLHFKLYTSREKNTRRWQFGDSLLTGVRIPDHAYYNLTATDSKGRQWKADRLLPDFNRAATGTVIIEGRLFEIACKGRFSSTMQFKNSTLNLWVFGNLAIPSNASTVTRKSIAQGRHKYQSRERNAWKFRCCGADFLLVKEDENLLTVQATNSKGRFPDLFEDRVVESLQFVLGRPIPWTIMKTRTRNTVTIKLSSRPLGSEKSRFLPPLPLGPMVNPQTGKLTVEPHKKLFECYLKHTLNYTRKRHPLWGQLNAVYEASTASFIDAKALTLTVAIESLLMSEYEDFGKLSENDKGMIVDFQSYLEKWGGNEKIKARIRGSINQLLQTRALDKMRELATRGVITNEQWQAWQKIRNTSTHSYQSTSISSDDLLGLLQKVEVLFYHLIFHAIGYKGPYMDFSTLGWPIKQYPAVLKK